MSIKALIILNYYGSSGIWSDRYGALGKRYLADKSSEMIFKCLRADAKHVVLPFLTAITPNFGRGIIIITELI